MEYFEDLDWTNLTRTFPFLSVSDVGEVKTRENFAVNPHPRINITPRQLECNVIEWEGRSLVTAADRGKGVVKRRLLGVKEHPIASFSYQLTNV